MDSTGRTKTVMDRIVVDIQVNLFQVPIFVDSFSFEGMFEKAACTSKSLIDSLGTDVEKMRKLVRWFVFFQF